MSRTLVALLSSPAPRAQVPFARAPAVPPPLYTVYVSSHRIRRFRLPLFSMVLLYGNGDEESKRRSKTHPKDRYWDGVGKRVKLVVDNQATAAVLNRKAACRNSFYKPVIRRCINWQYGFVQAGWKPFKHSGDFLERRPREVQLHSGPCG